LHANGLSLSNHRLSPKPSWVSVYSIGISLFTTEDTTTHQPTATEDELEVQEMSQQIPPPSPKRLRKGFLIIGIVFLTLGFFFVYWASRLNWDYVTTYKETVDLALPEHMSDYGFGYSFTFQTYGGVIEMQPNDYLTVGCPSPVSDGQTTLTVYKVLFGSTSRFQWDKYSKARARSSQDISDFFVEFR